MGAKLVIVDPLASATGASTSMNDEHKMKQTMAGLAEIAERSGAAIEMSVLNK